MSQYKNCIATERLGSWAGRWARLLGAGRAGVRSWRARGRRRARQAGRETACARGAVAGARGAQQERRHGRNARGRAAGAGRGARGGRLGGQCAPGCAQLGQVGVLCTLTQFLVRFDSVLFLSH